MRQNKVKKAEQEHRTKELSRSIAERAAKLTYFTGRPRGLLLARFMRRLEA